MIQNTETLTINSEIKIRVIIHEYVGMETTTMNKWKDILLKIFFEDKVKQALIYEENQSLKNVFYLHHWNSEDGAWGRGDFIHRKKLITLICSFSQ